MINPLSMQCVMFFISLILIQLPFSDLYSPPNISVTAIIFSYAFLSLVLGIFMSFILQVKKVNLAVSKSEYRYEKYDRYVEVVFFIFVFLEFFFCGIPLIGQVDYKDFGIPILHVLVYSLGLFLVVVYSFGIMMNEDKSFRIKYCLLICYSVLIVSRHFLLFSICTLAISYFSFKKVKKKVLLYWLAGGFVFIYLFGVIGTYRMSTILGVSYAEAEQYIYSVSKASVLYKDELNLGASWYWFWLYCTSPLSNLIETIIKTNSHNDYDLSNFIVFLLTELSPETISKRIVSAFEIKVSLPFLVVPQLNVATAISSSYRYLGVLGIFLYEIYVFIFVSTLHFALKRVATKSMSMVFFTSLSFFFIFDNMVSFPSFYVCAILFFLRDFTTKPPVILKSLSGQ